MPVDIAGIICAKKCGNKKHTTKNLPTDFTMTSKVLFHKPRDFIMTTRAVGLDPFFWLLKCCLQHLTQGTSCLKHNLGTSHFIKGVRLMQMEKGLYFIVHLKMGGEGVCIKFCSHIFLCILFSYKFYKRKTALKRSTAVKIYEEGRTS